MSNCTTQVEESDLVVLAAIRGSTAFLCSIINVLILISVSIRLDKSQLLYRMVIYLALSSLLAELADAPQVVSVFCYAPWYPATCVFVGFSKQLSSWLLLLVGLWLASVLSLRYWCPNHREALTARRDAGIWLGIVLLSVLVAVIPLGTGGYGLNQAQCWIKGSRRIEQWLLWYGWTIIAPVVAMVITTTGLCQSEKRQQQYYEFSRGINCTSQQRSNAAATKLKRVITYIAVYWVFVTLATILHQIPQVKNATPFLVTMAILEPLGVLLTLTVIVVHCHEPIRPRANSADFQHTRGEGSTSINSSCEAEGGGKKGKASKQDSARQEELRESLLLTMEMPDEFDNSH